MKSTKVFNGKTYHYFTSRPNNALAKRVAEHYRKQEGVRARVVKTSFRGALADEYAIYTKPKVVMRARETA